MYGNNDFGARTEPEHRLFKELSEERIVLYHGTSSELQRDVLRSGLKPNDLTGVQNFRGSRSGLVYIGIPEVAIQYSGEAAKRQGGEPILLEVVVSKSDLVPDQDSGLDPDERTFENFYHSYSISHGDGIPKWLQSMFRIGTCAHKGTIDKDDIEVYATQSDFRRLARKIQEFRTALRHPPLEDRIDNPLRFS